MEDLEKQERNVEEEENLLENVAVLDFDVLCSSVALKASQGRWGNVGTVDEEEDDENEVFGGVLRMWEGELFDFFDHRRIAIESTFCPCYRFGKNMKRAGFGSCYIQAAIYMILAIGAFVNFIAYVVTRHHCFLYISLSLIISVGVYLGFFRTLIRKKFNIKGSESSLDDCAYHFACPCCTLSQESRTLEMNNVQDGTWHGRGDTKCIGSFGEKSKTYLELLPPPLVSIKS
ncbi:uncharacterized protein LOC131607533 [Vicia villosa]|uniref:uncharacterized protein LOC131607533 n=1 Tax=Vicia villosa TaxID=3911 RepID=UPI00273BD6E3|nr:uncharacterized protein LOC131607533 [Vicia villosa]